MKKAIEILESLLDELKQDFDFDEIAFDGGMRNLEAIAEEGGRYCDINIWAIKLNTALGLLKKHKVQGSLF